MVVRLQIDQQGQSDQVAKVPYCTSTVSSTAVEGRGPEIPIKASEARTSDDFSFLVIPRRPG